MFSRKPQTALTTKKMMERKHAAKQNKAIVAEVKPANGYANINGCLLPF